MFAQKMHGFELVHVQTKAWFPLVNVNKKLWKDPPFLMGKSTISMAIFNSKLLVYQRVYIYIYIGAVQKLQKGF